MNNILKQIPNYSKWNKIKYIDKGWSKDKKYYIEDVDGMIKRAKMILDDYDNFTTYIPKWFTNTNKINTIR